jgi:DNA/RNA-binding domain of Phe-tRNA-synthetase-like protein
MTFALAPDLAAIVRPALVWLVDATVVEREPRLDAPLADVEAAMRTLLGEGSPQAPLAEGRQPDELRQRLQSVRTMYKQVGIDPTKRRPSSEALLRRVLKGDSLPRVNAMVDVCNWCSFESQLPYGLYDASRIDGDVTLRIGNPGESYPGIRKDEVHVGGRIALVDASGPFGNPTSDSARTMVTTATVAALVVIFAPRDVGRGDLLRVLEMTSDRMRHFTGARETGRWLP